MSLEAVRHFPASYVQVKDVTNAIRDFPNPKQKQDENEKQLSRRMNDLVSRCENEFFLREVLYHCIDGLASAIVHYFSGSATLLKIVLTWIWYNNIS